MQRDGQGPVLTAAREVVADLLRTWTPHLDAAQRERVAEACTRLIVSYAVSPAEDDLDVLSQDLAGLVAGAPRARDVTPSGTGQSQDEACACAGFAVDPE